MGVVIAAGAPAVVFIGSFLTFDRIDRTGFAIVQGIENLSRKIWQTITLIEAGPAAGSYTSAAPGTAR